MGPTATSHAFGTGEADKGKWHEWAIPVADKDLKWSRERTGGLSTINWC